MLRGLHPPLVALALLLSACAAGSASAPEGPPTPRTLQVGDTAPPFTALDSYGKPVSLDAFRGQKHVVLVFYIGHT
jgi:cytochrome oxidase Cu insertion factor (SCO1/SenC/PrrC family)